MFLKKIFQQQHTIEMDWTFKNLITSRWDFFFKGMTLRVRIVSMFHAIPNSSKHSLIEYLKLFESVSTLRLSRISAQWETHSQYTLMERFFFEEYTHQQKFQAFACPTHKNTHESFYPTYGTARSFRIDRRHPRRFDTLLHTYVPA